MPSNFSQRYVCGILFYKRINKFQQICPKLLSQTCVSHVFAVYGQMVSKFIILCGCVLESLSGSQSPLSELYNRLS